MLGADQDARASPAALRAGSIGWPRRFGAQRPRRLGASRAGAGQSRAGPSAARVDRRAPRELERLAAEPDERDEERPAVYAQRVKRPGASCRFALACGLRDFGARHGAGAARSAVERRPPTPSGEIIAGEPRTLRAAAELRLARPIRRWRTSRRRPIVDAAKVYSLADLIDLAESNNPTTRIAWNDARRAALAAGIAESAFLPRIAVSAVRGYQASSGQSSAAGLAPGDSGSASGSVAVVSMEWLLFDFGERAALVDAAKQASVDLQHRLHRGPSAAHLRRLARLLRACGRARPSRRRPSRR